MGGNFSEDSDGATMGEREANAVTQDADSLPVGHGVSGVVRVNGYQRPGLVWRSTQRRERAYILVCGLVAVFGLVMAAIPEAVRLYPPDIERVVGLAFLLLGAIVGLRRIQNGGSWIALLPEGIASSNWVGQEFVPWDGVEATALKSMVGANQTAVRAHGQTSRGGFARWVRRSNSVMGGWNYYLGPGNVGANAEELRNLIDHYVANPQLRHELASDHSDSTGSR
jgi:hypothetical protein